jgi:L-alanine-DL-glutamate epimerase-like enolase superfamily enzyme
MAIDRSGAEIPSGTISAFRIPTEEPESDGTAKWDSTTVVIVELTAGGRTGVGYSYAHAGAAPVATELTQTAVLGRNAFDIPSIHSALDVEARNWGRPGLVSTAISAIDNCLWDLKARLLGRPLSDLLGRARDEIASYGSGGFTSYSERQLVDQLTAWAAEGLPAVKMKIGRHPKEDVSRIESVQKELGGHAELYVDANGAYQRKQALDKAPRFADLGVTWFEEPVSSDDRIGLQMLVQEAPGG